MQVDILSNISRNGTELKRCHNVFNNAIEWAMYITTAATACLDGKPDSQDCHDVSRWMEEPEGSESFWADENYCVAMLKESGITVPALAATVWQDFNSVFRRYVKRFGRTE